MIQGDVAYLVRTSFINNPGATAEDLSRLSGVSKEYTRRIIQDEVDEGRAYRVKEKADSKRWFYRFFPGTKPPLYHLPPTSVVQDSNLKGSPEKGGVIDSPDDPIKRVTEEVTLKMAKELLELTISEALPHVIRGILGKVLNEVVAGLPAAIENLTREVKVNISID